MVQFLLHNSLGAWWAAKHLTPAQLASAASEQELRDAVALPGYVFTYLRFVRDNNQPWRPAAGVFEHWPKQLKQFTALDPCCGSGHFLVALLELLTRVRMADEHLSARDAVGGITSVVLPQNWLFLTSYKKFRERLLRMRTGRNDPELDRGNGRRPI
jgi:hypothetical protein